jgi:hypothetical protein
MNEHETSGLSRWGIMARVGFAFGLTAAVAIGAYFTIGWLAGMHR